MNKKRKIVRHRAGGGNTAHSTVKEMKKQRRREN
jgi:hypothetical protein